MKTKNQKTNIVGLPRVIVVGLVCSVLAILVTSDFDPVPNHALWSKSIVPSAYRIPKIPGATALRLAMVHDILHERYFRHGPAWYRQRNEDAQKIISSRPTTNPVDDRFLNAMDDSAVALSHLRQNDQAIAIMRKKLTLLPPLPMLEKPTTVADQRDPESDDLIRMNLAQNLSSTQHHQYTACANLGTILLIDCMAKALAGDAKGKAQMHESLDLIEHALVINPAGHFGRETRQAILIEDLLAAIEKPDLLGHFDFIGDSLHETGSGESVHRSDFIYSFRRTFPKDESQLNVEQRLEIRGNIERVGIEPDWLIQVPADYSTPMPFDEPTLAIVGMWTMGGGPSPHFALALARIMEQVGEKSIAWNAYERAVELQESFWPDLAIRKQMVDLCRSRQAEIAKAESTNPDAWQQQMHKQHQDELAWGIKQQNEYLDFEAAQIQAGVSIDDPHFYDRFYQGRAPIASDPGLSDDMIVKKADPLPYGCLGLGLGMCLALVLPEKHLS